MPPICTNKIATASKTPTISTVNEEERRQNGPSLRGTRFYICHSERNFSISTFFNFAMLRNLSETFSINKILLIGLITTFVLKSVIRGF